MKLIVEADGGSRGNPGPAGYGAVVKDGDSGTVLAEIAEALGTTTNNVAEYHGLIAGLRAAAEIDRGADVEVRMDSKLVVEQMRGAWRVKHPDLRPLASEAGGLVRSLRRVTFGWVPRERNGHADRLANEAMDRQLGRVRRTAASPKAADDDDQDTARARAFVPADLGTATHTVLVRHGETGAARTGWFNGATGDEPLTDTGRAQAAAVGKALADAGVEAIVSSPLIRARDTADVVGARLGLPIREYAGLREADFGTWEGLSMAEILEKFPDVARAWMTDQEAAPPGGESLAEVGRRAARARDKLVARYHGKTVLVVAHGLLLSAMVTLALDAPLSSAMRMRLENTSISVVDWYPQGYARLVSLNDVSHLRR